MYAAPQPSPPQDLSRSKRQDLATPPDLGLGWIQARENPGRPTAPRHMQITERSPKAEIISAACELADYQASRISELQQRQTILLALLGLVAVLELL